MMNIENGMVDAFHGEHIGRWGENVLLEALVKLSRSNAKSHQHQSSVVHGCRTGKRQTVGIGIFLVDRERLERDRKLRKGKYLQHHDQKSLGYIQQKGGRQDEIPQSKTDVPKFQEKALIIISQVLLDSFGTEHPHCLLRIRLQSN